MQTTITHEGGELVGYVGFGQHALLVYPRWLFSTYGAKDGAVFGCYRFDRGHVLHLGLVGFQWLSKRKKPRPAWDEQAQLPSHGDL